MTHSNSMTKQEKALDESNVLTRLLEDFLTQTKEDKPEKLFEDAYDYRNNLLSNPEKQLKFLQSFLSEPEKSLDFLQNLLLDSQKLLNFLQSVLLHSFRKRLCNMNDDDLIKDSTLSNDYATLFDDLLKGKNLKFGQEDRNNLKRNLEIERRAALDRRKPEETPLQIIPNVKRGLSSLGNLKDSRTVLQSQFEISAQISNAYLTSANVSSPTRVTKSLDVQSHSSGQKDVFKGKQAETEQKVAVKSSRSKQNDDATIREAEIQASIAHQGVPTIISLNKSVVPIIVEPYIDGQSWASKIDVQTLEEKMNVLLQVGAIMTYAHREAQIVHGDLKPDNVMIDDYGQVYVIDWGYAIKLTDSDEAKRIIRGSTEAYQPPEVCPPEGFYGDPQPATAAADVYMLGGILHQIVVPSKKTFNEAFSEASDYNYKISQWKNRNKFPEIPDVSKEMREVLQRALAYKPENRYQDAGEFVDALKKYQKKYQTLRRFNENNERFAQCKIQTEEAPSSNRNGKEAARNRNDLIACVDEFASIRKELEKIHNGPKQDASFFDVLSAELDARSFLLDCSINAQDFGQAQAIAETQEAVAALCQIDNQTSDFYGQITTELQAQRVRIAKGYNRRRRNNIFAFSAGVLFVLLLLSFGVVAHQGKQKALAENKAVQAKNEAVQAENEAVQAKNEAIEAENKAKEAENQVLEERVLADEKAQRASNQQLFNIYKRNAQIAQDEKFGQGVMSYWAKALELIDPITKKSSFPQCYNMLDIASKTTLLPQQISSFSPYVRTLGFSIDGRFFMTQDLKNNFDVWDAETLQTTARVKLSFPTETTTFIYPNPCFENENNDNPFLASRFIIINTGGDICLVATQEHRGNLTTNFFNVRNTANNVKDYGKIDSNALIMREDDFKKNLDISFDDLFFTSCFVTEKDSEGRALLFMGTKTGEVLTYSIPDFKLVGALKTQSAIFAIVASLQKKYVIINKDGRSCARYAFDGTRLNEYNLNFPSSNTYTGRHRFTYALSPSGEKMVIGNELGAICVWNVETNKLIAKIPKETFVWRLAYLDWIDEESFLSLGHNNDCRVWNLKEINSDDVPSSISIDCGLPNSSYSGIRTAAFSPKTQKLAFCGADIKLRFVDVGKGKLIAHTTGITASPVSRFNLSCCNYLPEKNSLIICSLPSLSNSSSVKLIDADSFEEIRSYNLDSNKKPVYWPEIPDLATSIAAPPVGSEFAVAMRSGKIICFNADDSNSVQTLDGFTYQGDKTFTRKGIDSTEKDFPIIAIDPQAKYLVGKTFCGDEFILWDWASKKELKRWKTSEGEQNQHEQKFESDSKKIDNTVAFDKSNVPLVNTEDSEQDDFEFDDNNVSSDSSEDFGQTDKIFDTGDTKLLPAFGLCFIDDDKLLEITDNFQLKLWDVSTGKLLRSNEVNSRFQLLSFYSLSHDRSKIALGTNEGWVWIVSTEDMTTYEILNSSYTKNSNLTLKAEDANEERKYISSYIFNDLINPDRVTGLSWSRDDKLLCVTYSNGQATIYTTFVSGITHSQETVYANKITTDASLWKFLPLTSFVITQKSDINLRNNHLCVNVFFVNKNRLITIDTNGSIQQWDYSPSKELAIPLWRRPIKKVYGRNMQQQEWANLYSLKQKKWISPYHHRLSEETFQFMIYSGTNLKCEIPNIEDFQFWNAPDGTSGYLLLTASDGKLTFLDGNRYEPAPSMLDKHPGFPENGLARICVSADGTKIAGIERLTWQTWLLDLSSPDSEWKQIPLRKINEEEADSFQLTFSPNSQTLATIGRQKLRLWDVKTSREIFRQNGELIETDPTSDEKNFEYNKLSLDNILFISDNLIVLTVESNMVCIWDVRGRSLFQGITVPLFSWRPAMTSCESLNKGIGKDRSITFCVAGSDGIIRFYQLSPKTNQFEPIYAISQLELSVLSDLGEFEYEKLENLSPDVVIPDVHTLQICHITLSEDGKTLYVGSSGGLYSYNMEEIWKNIDELPQKWQNTDVESLTGLRFGASGELTPFVPNHMVHIDNKKVIENSSEEPTTDFTNQSNVRSSAIGEFENNFKLYEQKLFPKDY